MKKYFSLLSFALIFALALAACADTGPDGTEGQLEGTEAVEPGFVTEEPLGEEEAVPETGDGLTTPENGGELTAPEAGEMTQTPELGAGLTTPEAGEATASPEAGEATASPEAGGATPTSESEGEVVPGTGQEGTPEAGEAQPSSIGMLSELIGMNITGAADAEVGEINSVILNNDDGQIAWVLLDPSNDIVEEEGLVAVPWAAFDIVVSSEADTQVTLNQQAEVLAGAPVLAEEELAFGSPEFDGRIEELNSYYESQNISGLDQAEPANLTRFTEVSGLQVVGPNGEEYGTLDNMLYEPSEGQVRYMVLGAGGFLGIGEQLIPVPYEYSLWPEAAEPADAAAPAETEAAGEDEVTLEEETQVIMILAISETLEQAPAYDDIETLLTSTEEIDGFWSGVEPAEMGEMGAQETESPELLEATETPAP